MVKRFPFGSAKVIGQSQDAAQIIRWMTPFGGEPGIVKVEPTNHSADIKRGVNRFELPIGAWYTGAVG